MTIDHLLVVAGPPAAGKSYLIRELLAHRMPDLETRLDLGAVEQWTRWNAHATHSSTQETPTRLILEYDFLWHELDRRQPANALGLALLAEAAQVSFVTVWTPPARLERQF